MDDGLTTIATFLELLEAQVARGLLEVSGIECVLLDEYATGIHWAHGDLGGIRLQVRESEAETARAVLASPAPPTEPDPEDRA
ncbi:MAG TPA: DUF2007 domain-containing protein [Terriglobales bacterium]|nr:DUF2007 domain-containing protein [Terriglobales bacterium]